MTITQLRLTLLFFSSLLVIVLTTILYLVVESPNLVEKPPTDTKPAIANQGALELAIKQLLAEKYDKDRADIMVTVSSRMGDFARGGVGFLGEYGGGIWLATLKNDQWALVHDGLETPSCDLVERYQFPVKVVDECLDEGDQLLQRTDPKSI